MNNELITEDGTYWDSDGEAIEILHINEQWPLWLTKADLQAMLKYLEIEEAHKEKDK